MIDTHAATELKLYIDNDSGLYRGQTTSILKNLATKRARGEYKHDLAVKAFGYLVESGAKKYAKDFGGTWNQMFSVPTRKRVAEELADDFEAEAKLGNYDNLLPKKYQGSVSHVSKPKQVVRIPDAGYLIALHGGDYLQAFARGRGPLADSDALKRATRAAHELANNTRMVVDVVGVSGRGNDRYVVAEVSPSGWKR